MSGVKPPVGAASSSSAAVPPTPPPPPPPLQQQLQEMTAAVAQLSDTISELVRHQQQQQQQDTTAAARSRSDELRGWLMLVATLTASITYSAALNPPGGVWQADDPAKGYVAGRPVLYDKSNIQYVIFCYSNFTSFATSLCIIALSSTPSLYNKIERSLLSNLVGIDIVALAGAFMAGSAISPKSLFVDAILISVVPTYILFGMLIEHIARRIYRLQSVEREAR